MAKHHNLCKTKNYRRALRYQSDYILTTHADPKLLKLLRTRCVFRIYGLVPPNWREQVGCVNTELASHFRKLTQAEVDLDATVWDSYMNEKGKF